jgi:hypothetical protein
MNDWANFFIAQTGAAAALTGLIFVAVSLNLTKILSFSYLPVRALQSLMILMTILIVSSLMLVPQSLQCAGLEIFIIGAIVCIIMISLDLKSFRAMQKEYVYRLFVNIILGLLALIPYLIAGILMWMNYSSGIYWLIPAVIISFMKALMDAWVLLVEINR